MNRLFHVSEELYIPVFIPRVPKRADLSHDIRLIWAIDEESLPHYLLPRDCPRVCYRMDEHTSKSDEDYFFVGHLFRHVIAIEANWLPVISRTKLCCYEFDPAAFQLQDQAAGYYVSEQIQKPIGIAPIDDIWIEMLKYPVEVKVCTSLLTLANEVSQSTLRFSCIRMQKAYSPL